VGFFIGAFLLWASDVFAWPVLRLRERIDSAAFLRMFPLFSVCYKRPSFVKPPFDFDPPFEGLGGAVTSVAVTASGV